MKETVTNLKVRYYVGLPLSWFEISKLRLAARQAKMSLPKYLRTKLELENSDQ